jgi:hypothetical protein
VSTRPLLRAFAATFLLLPVVAPADQPLAGRRFSVSDASPGDAADRRVVVTARQKLAPGVLTGDPSLDIGAGGAVLELAANGATPTSQALALPQGTAAEGGAFWNAVKDGFKYRDPDGEQGPVRVLVVKQTPKGLVRLKAVVEGDGLALAPPDPGTDALAALTLSQGDRFCVQFGADGAVHNDGARSFRVRRPKAVGCGVPPEPSGEFRALSYNVAGLPEGLSGSHPETNTPIISPLLNAYDFVLVQESWQTPDPNPLEPLRVYHEILAAGATHPYKTVSAPLPLGQDPRRPEALVSDGLNAFSQFPFTHLDRQMWSTCVPSAADCLSQKGFMFIRVVLSPGIVVDVYDLHMEAGGDPEDDTARDLGVTQLATYINEVSAGRPVIVGGDFNLHTDEEPDSTQFQRLLAETGLSDVCATLACPEPGRIDKFLFRSSAGLTIEPLSWQFDTATFVDGMGEPLSDHDPLAVRFRWTAVAP